MKKYIALLLVVAVLTSLCIGCGNTTTEAPVDNAAVSEKPVSKTDATDPVSVMDTSVKEETDAEIVLREPLNYPLTEEQVTLTMFSSEPTLGPLTFMGGDYGIHGFEDYAAVQESFQRTGVTVEFSNVSSMESTTLFALHVASGDLCDMLAAIDLNYSGGVGNAYAEDIVVDLSPYAEEWCPQYLNLIEEDPQLLKSTRTPDGEMLMMYYFNDCFIQAEGSLVRTDWLQQVDQEVPTTIEELHEVLLAFQSEIGCAHPFYFNSGCNRLLSSYNLHSYTDLSSGELAIFQEDGTVYSNFTHDRFREWLRTMNTWYEEGLFDQDFISIASTNMGGEDETLLSEDNLGVWFGNINSISNYYAMCPNENFEVAPVYITADGENNHTISTSRLFGMSTGVNGVGISSDCENVELAMGWLDFWYTEEGYRLKNYGVEGESYELVDGKVEYTDAIMNNDMDLVPAVALLLYSTGASDWGMGAQDRTMYFYDDIQLETQTVWTDACDGTWAYPNATLTTDESGTVASKGGDVCTYIAQCVPSFIMGEMSVESDWDTYVETCNSMGLTECVEAYQSALDRYNGIN